MLLKTPWPTFLVAVDTLRFKLQKVMGGSATDGILYLYPEMSSDDKLGNVTGHPVVQSLPMHEVGKISFK